MSTTTQAAVKSALKTSLLARPGLAGVQVKYGEPGDDGRRECVWMGTSSEQAPQERRVLRKGARDETYTLKVHVESALNETPEKTETRAVVLAAEVEATVIADPILGGAIPAGGWITPSGIELATTETGDGPRSIATVSLDAKARLN